MDPLLASWGNYYVIIGSSGAALIGLQFVVITLISGMRRRLGPDAIGAFGTPTVVHLTGALLVSASLSAPWATPAAASVPVVLSGLAGLAYGAIVIRRTRRQSDYDPVWEDWLWFTILPGGCYAAIVLGGILLRTSAGPALFVVGGAALGLLLIGIHNAWDAVTHILVTESKDGA